MRIGKLTIGIVLAALAVKVLAEKFALFMECSVQSTHTISECLMIGILY